MATRLLNNSPLSRLSNRVGELEGVLEKLVNTFHYDAHEEATRLPPIDAFKSNLGRVRACTNGLRIDIQRSGRIDPTGASLLGYAYETLDFSLGLMGEIRTSDDIPLSRHARFAKIREETRRLGESVRLVTKALDEQSEADMEKDPSYVNSRKLRQAVQWHDAKLGRNLRLKELDDWLTEFSDFNWHDEKMVNRVAKLFVLGNIPGQTWELRCRSRLPGRPNVIVMETIDFPGPEFLEIQSLPPAEYYVAAKLPTWRIVWKMSWYDTF